MAYLIGPKNRPPIPKSEGPKQSESADYNRQSVDPCSYVRSLISAMSKSRVKLMDMTIVMM